WSMRRRTPATQPPVSFIEAMPPPLPSRLEAASPRAAALLSALIVLVLAPAVSAQERTPAVGEIEIVYLSQPGQTQALAGARLGLADDNATGRFLGQSFRLRDLTISDEKIVADLASSWVVADLPRER